MWMKRLTFWGVPFLIIFGLWAVGGANDTASPDPAVSRNLKTAYEIAMTVFTDDPTGTLTREGLESYGFRSPKNVTIQIVEGRKDRLKIVGRSVPGNATYVLNKDGEIKVRSRQNNKGAPVTSGHGN